MWKQASAWLSWSAAKHKISTTTRRPSQHSSWNVDGSNASSTTPFCSQTKRNTSWLFSKQQQQEQEATLAWDKHHHTHHRHKAVWKDSTEHSRDKSGHWSPKSTTTTAFISQHNIHLCHGLYAIQPTYSTGTQSIGLGKTQHPMRTSLE